MSKRWPLGPEVTRTPVERGAMLYDSSRAGNLDLQWFDVRYWESQNAIEGAAKGRGRARFINAPGLKLVLRAYRRGGLVARLISRKRYVWKGEDRTRPFREWLLTYRMHRAGLPVAAPIAAHYRRRLGLYTGELITERLSVKGTLVDCLMKEPLSVLTWVAIGRCIRRFHDFGVCHADLNVRNVLIGEDDAIYLIDFDRCSLRKPGLWRDGNLVRLRRSLEKVTYGLPPDRFTEADWHALLDGYRQSSPKPQPVTGGFIPATSPPALATVIMPSPVAPASQAPAAHTYPATVVMPSPGAHQPASQTYAPTVIMPSPVAPEPPDSETYARTEILPSPFASTPPASETSAPTEIMPSPLASTPPASPASETYAPTQIMPSPFASAPPAAPAGYTPTVIIPSPFASLELSAEEIEAAKPQTPAPKETAKEAPKEAPKETPKEAPKETLKETAKPAAATAPPPKPLAPPAPLTPLAPAPAPPAPAKAKADDTLYTVDSQAVTLLRPRVSNQPPITLIRAPKVTPGAPKAPPPSGPEPAAPGAPKTGTPGSDAAGSSPSSNQPPHKESAP